MTDKFITTGGGPDINRRAAPTFITDGCKTDYMPRRDWNTPQAHTQKPHHKKMHSPAHGAGYDKKLRAAKRVRGDRRDRCPFCGHPTLDVSRHKRIHKHANSREADSERT